MNIGLSVKGKVCIYLYLYRDRELHTNKLEIYVTAGINIQLSYLQRI
jgi:hypothetical protein